MSNIKVYLRNNFIPEKHVTMWFYMTEIQKVKLINNR